MLNGGFNVVFFEFWYVVVFRMYDFGFDVVFGKNGLGGEVDFCIVEIVIVCCINDGFVVIGWCVWVWF